MSRGGEVKINSKNNNEHHDREMKEYAKTAMNELLGWYGYDKMDTDDAQALNLSVFSRRQSTSSEESTKSVTIKPDTNGKQIECSWCHSMKNEDSFDFKNLNDDKRFCSEVCFTQHRRANFKRNRTCDWCRHVRHTVNYVDLQDGDTQYQFCSDKCLNQFKLDIFCQETKEHFEIHPHDHEQFKEGESTSSSLITPDLWLRNCSSPPICSDGSRTPSPVSEISESNEVKYPRVVVKEKHPKPLKKLSKISKRNKTMKKVKYDDSKRSPAYASPNTIIQKQTPSTQVPPLLPISRPQPTTSDSNFSSSQTFHQFLRSLLPPPTVLTPYPIPLPIPIPIPIPVPIPIFINKDKSDTKIKNEISPSSTNESKKRNEVRET